MESKSSPFQKTVPTLIPHHCRDALCLWKGSCYHLTRCADRSSLWLLQSNLKLPKRIGVQIKGETDSWAFWCNRAILRPGTSDRMGPTVRVMCSARRLVLNHRPPRFNDDRANCSAGRWLGSCRTTGRKRKKAGGSLPPAFHIIPAETPSLPPFCHWMVVRMDA